MTKTQKIKAFIISDLGILLLLGILRFATLFLTNGQSGWHRDELDMLENARQMDWGYVSYPPITPLIARLALMLFGPSMVGVRFFSTLAHAIALVLTGLIVRDLGGRRWAQVTAALAAVIAPYALMGAELFHYSSFDYLWWVLIAFLIVRLLKTENPRYWLGIGAVIGLGLMTKYAIGFYIAGVVVGVLLTRTRRYLLSPWLWSGVGLAFLIVLPNLIWQYQHNFITYDFLISIHARDVNIGRAEGYLSEQFIYVTNLVTIPFWIIGLVYYFFAKDGRKYQIVGWMYLVPFALLLVTKGRSYYLAPAYPMLLAGGATQVEQWLAKVPLVWMRLVRGVVLTVFTVSGVIFAPLALPVAKVNSVVWNYVSKINAELREEIGWPELVKIVADIYQKLPAQDQAQTGILAANYGEIGAINLYGPAYGLPKAISGMNNFWLRGYGDPPPQVVILVGSEFSARKYFDDCKYAGRISNLYNVPNIESTENQNILVCRGLRIPWPDFWKKLKSFG
jgi:4-amino-4-deoxy-L-arabinose transferase-like glycosyltransferase